MIRSVGPSELRWVFARATLYSQRSLVTKGSKTANRCSPRHSIEIVGDHLMRRLRHFGCGLHAIAEATVWVHPSVEVDPGPLLDTLQEHVFRGVVPAISFIRSPMLCPEALIGVKVTAYSPVND